MNLIPRHIVDAVACAVVAGAALPAAASNGVYLSGNGPSSIGMAGASIAFPQDATAAADNPAGMAELGNRFDINGLVVSAQTRSSFGSPDNEMTSRVNAPGLGGGFNYQVAPKWTMGVSVSGAGLGVDYGRPVVPAPGVETAKVNVAIGNILPTVTYSPVPNFSVGASLVVGIQQFRGSGVVAPSPAGGLMGLPSHGTSYAFGVGGGVGVMWKPLPEVSLGASYFTKTRFSNLRGYKDDLLAGAGGHLDLPSRYGVGVAWRPVPSLTLALDYLRINWSDSAALGDPASFNWHDQNVVRIGAAWRVNPAWTIRAGFSRANSYADSNHTPANFYAAGINNRTVSVGASYAIDKTNELTFAFEYNIPRTLMGTGAGTGTNIHNALQVFTLGYSHKF